MKTCSGCRIEKDLSCFAKNITTKDGYQYYCKSCQSDMTRKWFFKNHTLNLEKSKNRRMKIPKERWREYGRRSRLKHREKINARVALWWSFHGKKWYEQYKNDPENNERMKLRNSTWKKMNKDKVNASTNARRAQKILATPAWADNLSIMDMYAEAVYQQMTVDHIVPLRSAMVCGLHWEGNLQLLSLEENSKKHNKKWPDMWCEP